MKTNNSWMHVRISGYSFYKWGSMEIFFLEIQKWDTGIADSLQKLSIFYQCSFYFFAFWQYFKLPIIIIDFVWQNLAKETKFYKKIQGHPFPTAIFHMTIIDSPMQFLNQYEKIKGANQREIANPSIMSHHTSWIVSSPLRGSFDM